MKIIPTELSPMEDRAMFRVMATGPEGASFEYMDVYVKKVLDVVEEEVPEMKNIVSITSPSYGGASSNSAMMFAKLVESDERQQSQTEIVNRLRQKIKLPWPGLLLIEPQSIGSPQIRTSCSICNSGPYS